MKREVPMLENIRETITGVYGEEKLARWVSALEQAPNGEKTALDEHARAIVLALLSGRKYGRSVSQNPGYVDGIFSQYALEYITGGTIEKPVPLSGTRDEADLQRLFGPDYLGVFEHVPSKEEADDVIEQWSLAHNLLPGYIRKILKIFCSDDLSGICGSKPLCDRCGVRQHCSYGKNMRSPYGEPAYSTKTDNVEVIHGFFE